MSDNIRHPPHYNSSDILCYCGRQIECIDITKSMDFCLGNVIKYIWRHKHKNGIEDLRKAHFYLDYYIKYHEELESK